MKALYPLIILILCACSTQKSENETTTSESKSGSNEDTTTLASDLKPNSLLNLTDLVLTKDSSMNLQESNLENLNTINGFRSLKLGSQLGDFDHDGWKQVKELDHFELISLEKYFDGKDSFGDRPILGAKLTFYDKLLKSIVVYLGSTNYTRTVGPLNILNSVFGELNVKDELHFSSGQYSTLSPKPKGGNLSDIDWGPDPLKDKRKELQKPIQIPVDREKERILDELKKDPIPKEISWTWTTDSLKFSFHELFNYPKVEHDQVFGYKVLYSVTRLALISEYKGWYNDEAELRLKDAELTKGTSDLKIREKAFNEF